MLCAIEEELRTIVYQHNYRPVLKEISTSFRSVVTSIVGTINGEVFNKLPKFSEFKKAILKEVRSQLFAMCRSYISHLRLVTLRKFSVWLIAEQKRIQSLRYDKPFWHETDASGEAGLNTQVEFVYERLYDKLEGELLPNIGEAVKAYFQEQTELCTQRK